MREFDGKGKFRRRMYLWVLPTRLFFTIILPILVHMFFNAVRGMLRTEYLVMASGTDLLFIATFAFTMFIRYLIDHKFLKGKMYREEKEGGKVKIPIASWPRAAESFDSKVEMHFGAWRGLWIAMTMVVLHFAVVIPLWYLIGGHVSDWDWLGINWLWYVSYIAALLVGAKLYEKHTAGPFRTRMRPTTGEIMKRSGRRR